MVAAMAELEATAAPSIGSGLALVQLVHRCQYGVNNIVIIC